MADWQGVRHLPCMYQRNLNGRSAMLGAEGPSFALKSTPDEEAFQAESTCDEVNKASILHWSKLRGMITELVFDQLNDDLTISKFRKELFYNGL